MSLIVYNVESASLSISFEKELGNTSARFIKTGSYTVVLDEVSYSEGTSLLQGIDALKAAYKKKDIVARLGGDDFTRAQLTSLSFDESSLSGIARATFTLVEAIPKENIDLPAVHLLTSFSDSFQSSRSEDTYSFNRSIDASYENLSSEDFKDIAKSISLYHQQNPPNLGFLNDSISSKGRMNEGFKTIKNESIDLINKTISFEESFDSNDIQGNKSKGVSVKTSIDENGYETIEHSIELKVIKGSILQIESMAEQEIVSLKSSSSDEPISISKAIDPFSGAANLTVVFSNDPSKSAEGQETISAKQDFDGNFFSWSLTYSISISKGSRQERVAFVKDKAWNVEPPTILKKFFDLEKSGTPTMISKNLTFSDNVKNAEGSIQATFSEHPKYKAASQHDGILQFDISETTSEDLDFETIIDLKDLKEKIIVSKNPEIKKTTINIRVVHDTTEKGFFFGRDFALSQSPTPNGFIESDSISVNLSGETQRTISFFTF